MIAPQSRTTDPKRRVNELISESLARGGRDEPVAFFCECGDPDCDRAIWLAPAAYEEARRDPDWVAVAFEHEALAAPVHRAAHLPLARRRAQPA